jgi:hypothetical protein
MSKPTHLIALLALALGLAAVPAGAASPSQIIDDCSSSDTGLLKKDYSKADLRRAQKQLTGDLSEYTGCPDAIAARLRYRAPVENGGDGNDGSSDGGTGGGFDGGTGGTGSSGGDWYDAGGTGAGSGSGATGGATAGGAPTTPGGTAAPTAPPTPQPGSAEPVRLAGQTVTPGFTLDGDARTLPTPLIAFLVLLAAGAVGIGLPTIGRRVLARRRG